MKQLGKSGVDAPRRDSLVLLEDTLSKNRAWVLAHPEYELSKDQLGDLDILIKRRMKREPLAYIRGKAWFYGRFFQVNPNVLIPRPESENFIDILKEFNPREVIDLGTGSGCLAVSAKLEVPGLSVIATDIDQEALKVAQKNAKAHKTKIKFIQSDLLDSISKHINDQTTIIANLPYVPDSIITGTEITKEPATALFSGKDGLDHYRIFWQQVSALDKKPGYILIESLQSQQKELENLALRSGFLLVRTNLLVSLFKHV